MPKPTYRASQALRNYVKAAERSRRTTGAALHRALDRENVATFALIDSRGATLADVVGKGMALVQLLEDGDDWFDRRDLRMAKSILRDLKVLSGRAN